MSSPHLAIVIKSAELVERRRSGVRLELDGNTLHIADVVVTAYDKCIPHLTKRPEVVRGLSASVEVLMDHLAKGHYIYGVNSGYGGSAETRTTEVVALQAALMQLTQAGILRQVEGSEVPALAMPASWVRAIMTVRCNATIRGHSAVSQPILQAVVSLMEHRLTPVVPLRGSVSASGDLMPLAYIAGAIEGNPDILVEVETDEGQSTSYKKTTRILSARDALREVGLKPVVLGPKEGLGLVNGTAASAAVGALVMHEAHQLAVLTQALTGVAVEALRGSVESFHPFIAAVRPHPGQIECARNIKVLLQGSHLTADGLVPKDHRREGLIQDRYSLRSAPQWIGPSLEDLQLAHEQISTELNSSCDNPLVNSATGDILYGCNFQASSVTTAVEKTRLAAQMFGRLLAAQVTEMIDPTLSGGLPANLSADDPSLSFPFKGIDIAMAAYLSELSFLANPLSSHVQPAEMHNQSINSMALASARISLQALDLLAMIAANHLYTSLQAVDLRALHQTFVARLPAVVNAISARRLDLQPELRAALEAALSRHVSASWLTTGKLDPADRCRTLVSSALAVVLAALTSKSESVSVDATALDAWQQETVEAVLATWKTTSEAFFDHPHTEQLLGAGARALYRVVRQDLGVPFHLGFIEHPTADSDSLRGRQKKTVGGWVSVIYDAIKGGRVFPPLLALLKQKKPESKL